MSPELALIDHDLAAQARERLVAHDLPDERVTVDSWIAPEALGALERIVELADLEPPTRRLRLGRVKFLGAAGTWVMAAYLLEATHLLPS